MNDVLEKIISNQLFTYINLVFGQEVGLELAEEI